MQVSSSPHSCSKFIPPTLHPFVWHMQSLLTNVMTFFLLSRSCEVLPTRCFSLGPVRGILILETRSLKILSKCSYVCDGDEKYGNAQKEQSDPHKCLCRTGLNSYFQLPPPSLTFSLHKNRSRVTSGLHAATNRCDSSNVRMAFTTYLRWDSSNRPLQ